MVLPDNTKLPFDETLAGRADLLVGPSQSIAEGGGLSRETPVEPAEDGSRLLPSVYTEPMTSALQLALAKQAVSGRLARRRK